MEIEEVLSCNEPGRSFGRRTRGRHGGTGYVAITAVEDSVMGLSECCALVRPRYEARSLPRQKWKSFSTALSKHAGSRLGELMNG